MKKDFDAWNIKKKQLDSKKEIRGVHQREIWWVSLGLNVGVEINGKHRSYERTAIVLRCFSKDMVWVIPVTSQTKDSPFYAPFALKGKTYHAALTQLRTLSTKRLLRKIGMISQGEFANMQHNIAKFVCKYERSSARGGASRRPKP